MKRSAVRLRHTHQSQRADGLWYEDRADVRTKLSTLFTVVRPKARHNHPMTVRGFETADGRTVEHGQFGGFQDVSDGGLAQALVEGVLRYGTGARVALPFDLDPFEALFSDSAARAVVAVRARAELRVRELCEATGVPYTPIGTTGGDALHIGDLFDVRLDELRAVHEATLPAAFER
jgi:phosphoribosylformylglycinamidine (FGAM) synthase-like enzyme